MSALLSNVVTCKPMVTEDKRLAVGLHPNSLGNSPDPVAKLRRHVPGVGEGKGKGEREIGEGMGNGMTAQLSVPSLRSWLIEYQPVWLRLRRGEFTCVGWQVA